MPYLENAHIKTYYHQDYFGHETTLIFSNSLGTDYTMWEPQIDILSHHYNILRYDTRGHGKSKFVDATATFTIKDLGNDVIELLDHLKLKKVMFCGLSMGGQIGQWLGIHHPERFHKMILANTAAKIGDAKAWNSRIEYVTEHALSSILEGTAERWFTKDFREKHPKKVQEVLDIFIKTSLTGYIACCKVVRDAVFIGQLENLEVPTLVLSGLKDTVTTVAHGNYMARHIGVASHISLDAAHLSNMECSRDFAKFILYFTEH